MTRTPSRAVENAWRLTLGLLIFSAASCAVVVLHDAFFAGIDAQWSRMTLQLIFASSIGWGVWWLCKNRADLAGE